MLEALISAFVKGLLTGMVYGLMALGLSVIFGVMKVVNFAHGEMMVCAMYLCLVLFNIAGLDPLLALPLAAGEVVPLGDDYLLDLRTGPVPGPEFVLQGIVRGGRTLVEGGILLVADPRVPFGFAAWSAARTGE